MAKVWAVRVERVVRCVQVVEVVADDENEAADLGPELASEDDWKQEDEDYEVLEVSEASPL